MFNMRILFANENKSLFLGVVIFGIITSLLNLMLIYFMTHLSNITNKYGLWYFLSCFLIVAALYLIANYCSFANNAKLTNKIIMSLRLKLQNYILVSDYSNIEKIGHDALYAINYDDIGKIEQYAEVFPRVIINIFLITAIISYMLVLNWKVTTWFIFSTLLVFIVFMFIQKSITRQYKIARQTVDFVAANINDLIYGIRELKINLSLRKLFYNVGSIPLLHKHHQQRVVTSKYEQMIISYFWLSFYIILTVCLIILNNQATPNQLKYIMPLFMIFGPLTMIMNSLNAFYSAKVAVNKLNTLSSDLEVVVEDTGINEPFKSLQVTNLGYSYYDDFKEKTFEVGPLSFNLEAGEIMFITGGNGSGKSTLIKLLTLLYKSNSGFIQLNNNYVVTQSTDIIYQSQLVVIYQTPHIFTQVLQVDLMTKNEKLDYYLTLLELNGKIQLEDNRVLNLDKLSYGQKKRLGLLIALLDDKAIYIFDEWAADQDPHFRKVFYMEILNKLKAEGKAVIAVTHDDEYFNVADQIIKLRVS